ncbi:hypothetical protein [Sphingomonas sp. CLY1604]|uniref:hypothetical protein n=1 Tax=Sphingomonas sp. CLY1604 TaxID=3457786 RepID=UPI003FD7A4B1
MSRIKLGLFGAARQSAADDRTNDNSVVDAYRQEHLSGLTPVERAAAEAMMRKDALAA